MFFSFTQKCLKAKCRADECPNVAARYYFFHFLNAEKEDAACFHKWELAKHISGRENRKKDCR